VLRRSSYCRSRLAVRLSLVFFPVHRGNQRDEMGPQGEKKWPIKAAGPECKPDDRTGESGPTSCTK
jgi:hypothetical protein